MARRLLVTDQDWTEWELDFLESLAAHMGPDALTTRQREKLVELRDDAEPISTFNGFNIGSLIEQCWLARQDLSDEDNIEFLEELKTLKGSSAARSDGCCAVAANWA